MDPAVVAIWIGRALLATFATVAAWWVLKRSGPWLARLVKHADKRLKARGRGVSLVSVELVSLDTILAMIKAALGTVRYALMFLTAYTWLLVFTWALDESHRVFDAVVQPLVRAFLSLWDAVVDFVPNLAMVVVIAVVGRFATRTLTLLSEAIEEGRIEFPWLDKDLVAPTRRLGVIAVWLVALVMAVPYLPGSESKAFLGVGIALAVIVSLGSTSATANLLGGLVLTYTRAFHVGDRVRIGDAEGEVTGLGAFATRLRTSQNEEVVIPNAVVQSASLVNYSTHSGSEGEGVQVSVSVASPYETPWRKVHALLVEAAKHTHGVESEPEPFVIQRALGDSGVAYELRAYTHRAHELELLVGRLHQAVQDAFFKEGVELVAPKLSATREARSPRVPEGRKGIALETQRKPSREPRERVKATRAPAPSFVIVTDAKKPDEAKAKTELASDALAADVPAPDAAPAAEGNEKADAAATKAPEEKG